MKNLSIAARLIIGFSFVIALLVTIAVIGISRLALLDSNTRTIETQVQMMSLSSDIIGKTKQIAIALRNMMLAETDDDLNRQTQIILDRRTSILKDIEQLWPLVTDPRAREILERAKAQRTRYIEGQEKLVALIKSGSPEASRRFLNTELRPILLQYQDALGEFNTYQKELVAAAGTEAHEQHKNARNLSIGIVVVALAVSALMALWVIRSVTGPLGGEPAAALAVIERIAEGDLTATIPVRDQDTHSLMAATRKMQTSLRQMLDELRRTADGVANAAHEMATTSQQVMDTVTDISNALREQGVASNEIAVNVENIARRSEENSSAVRAVAETALHLERLAADTRQAVSRFRIGGQAAARHRGGVTPNAVFKYSISCKARCFCV